MDTDINRLSVDYDVRGVSLPTSNVTHSGVATAMFLSALDNGLLSSQLGINLSED